MALFKFPVVKMTPNVNGTGESLSLLPELQVIKLIPDANRAGESPKV
ncbi:MAG TPA: hypothetical protein GXX49_00475 [Clostridiaceae bacterium]|nr:hypothetical protein [Clostridiaceae bacterium]